MIAFVRAAWALLQRRWPFVVLATVAALHITGHIRVDGYGLGLLLLAFLPALLPVVAKHLKSIKVGKDGVEATILADNEGKPASELEERLIAANSKGFANSKEAEFPYSVAARRILATLWHYQKQLFGEDSLQRWGFGVGIGAAEYREFMFGASDLQDGSIVQIDNRGICYLTNEGIAFCKMHSDILDADAPHYTQFAPA